MATTIRCPVPGLYIDNVEFDSTLDDVQVINTVPENGEDNVLVGATIALWLVNLNAVTPAAIQAAPPSSHGTARTRAMRIILFTIW